MRSIDMSLKNNYFAAGEWNGSINAKGEILPLPEETSKDTPRFAPFYPEVLYLCWLNSSYMDILELARQNQQDAWNILDSSGIIPAWERIGATVHLVGSLKTGLMAKSRDIDLHIYTDKLDIGESFSVMQELAERLSFKEVQYKNLIHTEEECIEWHALYEDEKMHTWKFDMIHIRKNSKYDGVVEHMTDAIINSLTPEIRNTIIQIKFDVPDGVTIMGVEIYYAVFTGGVRSYAELVAWIENNPLTNSLDWLP
jgi:predicted nucleotidyltransferase